MHFWQLGLSSLLRSAADLHDTRRVLSVLNTAAHAAEHEAVNVIVLNKDTIFSDRDWQPIHAYRMKESVSVVSCADFIEPFVVRAANTWPNFWVHGSLKSWTLSLRLSRNLCKYACKTRDNCHNNT